ncbi:MAG: hypothetical protein V4658_10115 [Bacteroidota bacterium]
MKISYLLSVFVLLVSCGDHIQYVYKPKVHKLKTSQLYDSDLVYDVVFDSYEQNADSLRKKGRELFLQGADLYKNKHNAFAAITRFKASILIFPDAKTYYELGNALTDCNKYDEAQKAYNLAERLDFEPRSLISLKLAVLSYQSYLSNKVEKEYALSNAVNKLYALYRNGADESTVLKEKKLAAIVLTQKYKNMKINVEAERVKGNSNGLFALFKSAFRQNVSNLDIAVEEVEMTKYNQSISYEFSKFIPEMENTSFSRDVGNDFYYVGLVKETDMYVAVLYNAVTFYDQEMQPTRTMLAVYDHEGNLKTQKMVACQCSAEKIKRCSIKDNKVMVEDYLRVWEKPITEAAFEDNKVKAHNLIAKATFSIDDNGNIQNEDVPAGYNDSSIFAKAQ